MRSKPTAGEANKIGLPRLRAGVTSQMVERLIELRRHLDHLRELRPRAWSAAALRSNLSLQNDVLFSLLAVAQLVTNVASELSARRGLSCEDYTGAMHNLSAYAEIQPELIGKLEWLPGFRKALIRDLGSFDFERVSEALGRLDPLEHFVAVVREIEAAAGERGAEAG